VGEPEQRTNVHVDNPQLVVDVVVEPGTEVGMRGVVDQQPREFAFERRFDPCGGVRRGEIQCERADLHVVYDAERAGQRLGVVSVRVDHQDVRTTRGQLTRERSAEPLSAAGHDGPRPVPFPKTHRCPHVRRAYPVRLGSCVEPRSHRQRA